MSSATESRRQRRGAMWLILATIISGGTGYAITIGAGAVLGPRDYEPFAFFWSTLYLVVAAISGVQQEFARATTPATFDPASSHAPTNGYRLGVTALVGAVVVGTAAWASSPLWGPPALGEGADSLAAPLSVGIAGYVVVAILSGILSGIGAWAAVAAMTIADGLLRLGFVGAALSTGDPSIAAWAVVVPFIVVPLVAGAFAVRGRIGPLNIAEARGRLIRNSAITVVAAAAIGALVSGMPALLRATTPEAGPGALAGLVLAINLARAPLIIAVLALQSFLVVLFREARGRSRRVLVGSAAVAAVTVVSSLAGAAIGPGVIEIIGGEGFAVSPTEVALVMLSGGVIGIVTITGAAALARGRHGRYAAGWALSAMAATLTLAVMPDGDLRLGLALVLAPTAGIAVHLADRYDGTAPSPLH